MYLIHLSQPLIQVFCRNGYIHVWSSITCILANLYLKEKIYSPQIAARNSGSECVLLLLLVASLNVYFLQRAPDAQWGMNTTDWYQWQSVSEEDVMCLRCSMLHTVLKRALKQGCKQNSSTGLSFNMKYRLVILDLNIGPNQITRLFLILIKFHMIICSLWFSIVIGAM